MSLHDRLQKEFTNPSSPYRGKPFWAWNAELEEGELRRQIRVFKEMGFGGYFMHSRVGLATEYLGDKWFALTKACVEEAQQTGTEAWLYDEDRWPSGPAGGLVTKDVKYRLRRMKAVRCKGGESFTPPEDADGVWSFGIEFDGVRMHSYEPLAEGKTACGNAETVHFVLAPDERSSWYNGYTYLDTLNAEAVAEYIRITHERYRQEVGEHFGKAIPGIFTDEPNYGPTFQKWIHPGGALAWTGTLPQRFEEMFGIDVTGHLPEIFYEFVDGRTSKIRHQYYRCVTRMFVEAFAKQIGRWCEENDLLFTGHVLEEETIASQMMVVGSAMQFYAYMQAPGIDNLTQYWDEYIAAKQCASVAHQMGRPWVLSELYGCTGWETTFETYKAVGDWQAALGITLRCPHLSWYSMAGEAKRDYPASIHFQSPWWKQYARLEDYYSRLNVLLTAGQCVCDLLVIHPVETYSLLVHEAAVSHDTQTHAFVDERMVQRDQLYTQLARDLLGAHLDFDFGDEHLLVEFEAAIEHGEDGPVLKVGQMHYQAVLVPPMLTMRKSTLELLQRFAEAGGTVVFAEDVPEMIEAEASSAVKDFAAGRSVACDRDAIVSALEDSIRRVSLCDSVGKEAADVFYQLRQTDTGYVFFAVNRNRKQKQEGVKVCLKLPDPEVSQVQLWDGFTGKRFAVPFVASKGKVAFEVDLESTGSAMLFLATDKEDLPALPRYEDAVDGQPIESAGWEYDLDEPNVLVLDRCDCYAENESGGTFEDKQREILELDGALRDWLGIQQRGGAMVQPWVSNNDPLGPTAHVSLQYRFLVDSLPQGEIQLALEQPDRWTIRLNGNTIQNDADGWWVDPAIQTISVAADVLKEGQNTLTLDGPFDRKADLELVYLLGDFGTKANGMYGEMTTLPKTLGLGSWCEQGLAFYGGSVRYRTQADVQPQEDTRYVLRLGEHFAALVEVKVNGSDPVMITHGDYEADITDLLICGSNELELTLYGSRRNAFGPLHHSQGKDDRIWTGPDSYKRTPDCWKDDLQLEDYGLFTVPTIVRMPMRS